LIDKPRLKMFLTVYPLGDNGWGLRGGGSDSWSLRLRDPTAMRCFGVVLPLLDGSKARDDILEAVGLAGIDPAIAERLLTQLETEKLIENADDAGLTQDQLARFDAQIRLFSRFSNEGGAKHQAILLRSRVAVVGSGPLAEGLCRALAASGIGQVTSIRTQPSHATATTLRADDDVLFLDRENIFPPTSLTPSPKVVVVAQDTHDPEVLEAMDVFSKEQDIPWLFMRAIDQIEGWVGPLFVPGDTPSYVSFEARLRSNMQHYEQYVEFDSYARTPTRSMQRPGGLHAFYEILSGIAVTEIIKFVSGVAVPVIAGKFISVNMWTMETDIHEVLRFPRIEDEAYSRPGVFPWKEFLSSAGQTRRS